MLQQKSKQLSDKFKSLKMKRLTSLTICIHSVPYMWSRLVPPKSWPYSRNSGQILDIWSILVYSGKLGPTRNWPNTRKDHISDDHITENECTSKLWYLYLSYVCSIKARDVFTTQLTSFFSSSRASDMFSLAVNTSTCNGVRFDRDEQLGLAPNLQSIRTQLR